MDRITKGLSIITLICTSVAVANVFYYLGVLAGKRDAMVPDVLTERRFFSSDWFGDLFIISMLALGACVFFLWRYRNVLGEDAFGNNPFVRPAVLAWALGFMAVIWVNNAIGMPQLGVSP